MISTLIKRLTLAVTLAAVALPTHGFAQGMYNDIVWDMRGAAVRDMRGNCVYTKWTSQTNMCGAYAAGAAYIVFFDFDKATLTGEARSIIRTAAKNSGDKRIQLNGHADRSGKNKYNDLLSERRAKAVKRALVKLGIAVDRVTMTGKGEHEPLVPTEDGVREPQNRRVEIIYY